jgi:hypothetical protein
LEIPKTVELVAKFGYCPRKICRAIHSASQRFSPPATQVGAAKSAKATKAATGKIEEKFEKPVDETKRVTKVHFPQVKQG